MKKGQKIKQFDKVAEVQSDKATVDITSKYDGEVIKLHYPASATAQVGAPLIDIEVEEDEAKEAVREAEAPRSREVKRGRAAISVKAAPAVRRLASALGIDLSTVAGSGPGGRILEQDLTQRRGKAVLGRQVKLSAFQMAMSKQMAKSLQIPHFGLCDEVEVDALLALVKSNQTTFLPYAIKATSETLKEHPMLNATFEAPHAAITMHDQHNIGMAIDTPRGLVVPVIHNVQNMTVDAISDALKMLVQKSKTNTLEQADFKDGTFTISNIGSIAGTFANPILVAPQVGILAIGRIRVQSRFDPSGKVKASNVLPLSWSADHRVIDGATLARASKTLAQKLATFQK